tara:strand:- start:75 stop:428 length:354 start_codon:yes stop_codon:yes gene_type:complete
MARHELGEPYYRIDSKEAKDIVESEGDEVVVVDVRRLDEWVGGHVKNAIHIPIDDLLDRVDELPQGKKLLFICAAGVRSGLACEMAAAVGYPAEMLFNIEDGTPVWIESNYPTDYGN